MWHPLFLLLVVIIMSVKGQFSLPCDDICRSRTTDDVIFRSCVIACESPASNQNSAKPEDDEDAYNMAADLLRQLQHHGKDNDDADTFYDIYGSDGSPFGSRITRKVSSSGNWRKVRGAEEQDEGMSFVRIGKASPLGDSKKRLTSFVRIGRTPQNVLRFSDPPFVRLLNSEEDGDWLQNENPEEDFLSESSLPMGNLPGSVLRVRKSLNDEEMEREGSFDRTGKSQNEEDNERQQKEASSSSVSLGKSYNDNEATAGIEDVKRSPSSFVRIGKSSREGNKRPSFVRIGKSQVAQLKRPSFVRIGKSQPDPEAKSSDSFFRIARSSHNDEKRPSFVRIGKSLLEDKRPSFVRIGKSLFDEKRPSFVRIGKSSHEDEKRPSFVRIGKSLYQDKRPSFVRIGKSTFSDKRPSFVRIGRSRPEDSQDERNFRQDRSSMIWDDSTLNRNPEKRQSFVRIGKSIIPNEDQQKQNPLPANLLKSVNQPHILTTESNLTTWNPTSEQWKYSDKLFNKYITLNNDYNPSTNLENSLSKVIRR